MRRRAAGGDMLMVCNGNDMLKPGIYEVFKKYCGSSPKAPHSTTAE